MGKDSKTRLRKTQVAVDCAFRSLDYYTWRNVFLTVRLGKIGVTTTKNSAGCESLSITVRSDWLQRVQGEGLTAIRGWLCLGAIRLCGRPGCHDVFSVTMLQDNSQAPVLATFAARLGGAVALGYSPEEAVTLCQEEVLRALGLEGQP